MPFIRYDNYNLGRNIMMMINWYTYLKLSFNRLIHGHKLYKLDFNKSGLWVVLNNGVRLKYLDKFNSISSTITTYGSFEEQELQQVMNNLKSRSVFFDVGANVGLYSLMVANNFIDMDIYSFEPLPETMKELRENLKENNLHGNSIHLIQSAISNYDGFVNITSDLHSSNYITTPDSKINHLSVPCTTIDIFVKNNNIKKLDFIKIDVEGKEDLVLEGAMDSLRKFKPILLIELIEKNKDFLDRISATPEVSINKLLNLGYKYTRLDDSTDQSFHNYLFYFD